MRKIVLGLLVALLAACGGGGSSSESDPVTSGSDPRPHLVYAPKEQPLTYQPILDHSYYSPGYETVNVEFSAFAEPVLYGEAFPSDFVVQAQFSKTLAYVTKAGITKWTYPSMGRFVTATDSEILVLNSSDPQIVDVLDFSGVLQRRVAFDRPVNHAKIEAGRLIVVYAVEAAQVEIYGWSKTTGRGALQARSSSAVSYARSASLNGDRIAIADTFGQRTIIESLSTGQILASFPMIFPNDVSWREDFLFVVEEHADRVVAVNTISHQKFVVMAPPSPEFWEASFPSYPNEFCGADTPYARSRSADACSGAFTLYAPNGFVVRDDGMYVADTDNSRVVYVKDGSVVSVLLGLDNPVKVATIPD
jgi:hypothetical protein